MAGVLETVDQRTRLAGRNRLELLMFRLGSEQIFGINVFKVHEVIRCPSLTRVPNSHPVVRGIAHLRGKTISVIDLSMAVDRPPLGEEGVCYVVITEYNRNIQGFLVSSVDRIVNMKWEEILPPPKGSARGSYLTAVTRVDDTLVEIIDVEKVLAEVVGQPTDVSDELRASRAGGGDGRRILVVDDSSVARKQVADTLGQVGYECVMAGTGREALDALLQWVADGTLDEQVLMVISDIEMPEMDGYTLTAEIRRDPKLQHLYVLLHTSLSGVFNSAMVEQVGADRFIAKFDPNELAIAVSEVLAQTATG